LRNWGESGVAIRDRWKVRHIEGLKKDAVVSKFEAGLRPAAAGKLLMFGVREIGSLTLCSEYKIVQL
jgi:hypothetical protein